MVKMLTNSFYAYRTQFIVIKVQLIYTKHTGLRLICHVEGAWPIWGVFSVGKAKDAPDRQFLDIRDLHKAAELHTGQCWSTLSIMT